MGATGFVLFADNGGPGTDELSGFSFAPLAFGDLTIQQIVAILGPPPAGSLFPVVSGNVKLH